MPDNNSKPRTLETEVALLSERLKNLLDDMEGENGIRKRVTNIERQQDLCLQRQTDRDKNESKKRGLFTWIGDNAVAIFCAILSPAFTVFLLWIIGGLKL